MKRVVQECPDGVALDGPRVPVRAAAAISAACSKPLSGIPMSFRAMGAPSPRARPNSPCAASSAPSARATRAMASVAARGVVGGSVRQDDRMRLGVRQVEAATQRVAELVVQRHAHGT